MDSADCFTEDAQKASSRNSKASVKSSKRKQTKILDFDLLQSPKVLRTYVAEFIGMFFFLLISVGTICSTYSQSTAYLKNTGIDPDARDFNPNNATVLMIALGFGMSIMVLVYSIAFDSNHFNPAVTFTMMIFKKINPIQGSIMIVCQILGATCGVAMVYAIWPRNTTNVTNLGANGIAVGVSIAGAFFGEFFGTALLLFCVAGVVADKRNQNFAAALGPLAIGFAVLLAHLFLIPITGCGINPARTLGSAFISGEYENIWVYLTAPFLGGPFGFGCHVLFFQYKNGEKETAEQVRNINQSSDLFDEDINRYVKQLLNRKLHEESIISKENEDESKHDLGLV